MYIVIDGRMILPKMTGIGRYIIELAQALRDQQGEDLFELWLQSGLPPDHPACKLEGGRLSVRQIPLAHMQLRQQWVIPRLLRQAHLDLFHYPHFDLPFGVPGKVIASVHDLKYIARPEFFPENGRVKRTIMLGMLAYTIRRASRVITVSESTRQDILRRLGGSPEKIKVIHLAVDERFYQKAQPAAMQDFCQRYGLDKPYILFVSERRPHKNINGLIEAYLKFQRMTPHPYQLIIAGMPYAGYRGPENLVEQLNLTGQVRFLDYVPDEDLPMLYQKADVFALLSHYEGFGLPVLEAMASGTPVIAARATSLPEVCSQAGLLVDPDNPEEAAQALVQAIPGGVRREELQALGLERSRQFTWDKCALQTLNLYHETISA